MAYHLYVPFKKNDIPANQQTLINEWMQLEKVQCNDLTVSYLGEKALSTLPENADVRVFIPGTPGKRSRLQTGNTPTEQLRFWPSLSRHLRVTEGKSSLLVPEIADNLVADGLFDSPKNRLRIKLYFLNTSTKESHELARSFYNALESNSSKIKKIPLEENGKIRVSYHYAPKSLDPGSKKSKIEQIKEHMEQPKFSIYNNEEFCPKLLLKEANSVIASYKSYKSSRCCGLSGLLRLNGLFSSDASEEAIQFISDKSKSDTERFIYASRYVALNKDTHLSLYLKPFVTNSREQNERAWADESSTNLIDLGF